jgi:hypothetical protein
MRTLVAMAANQYRMPHRDLQRWWSRKALFLAAEANCSSGDSLAAGALRPPSMSKSVANIICDETDGHFS